MKDQLRKELVELRAKFDEASEVLKGDMEAEKRDADNLKLRLGIKITEQSKRIMELETELEELKERNGVLTEANHTLKTELYALQTQQVVKGDM